MAETSYPFDAGAGTAVDEAAWRAMASRFLASGVIGASTRDAADTSLLTTLGSGGAGGIFQMAAGEAFLSGIKYTNDATLNKMASTNLNSNPRIDRLALKLDTTANTCVAVIVEGTPAASPTSPAMPDTSTVIHLPLYRATCPGSASAQNYSNLVHERMFIGGRLYVGPSTGAAVAGVAGFQNGDEWLQTDTKDRLLRLGGTWVGTRPRQYAGTNTSTGSPATSNPSSGTQFTVASLTVPDLGYAYQIRFTARCQVESLGSDNYVEGWIREANASSGTIRAEGSAFARGALDAALLLPETRPLTVAAGASTTWYFTIRNNVGSGVIRWTTLANYFAASVTPLW